MYFRLNKCVKSFHLAVDQTCGEMLISSDILQYVYCNSPWCLPVNYLHLGLLDLDRNITHFLSAAQWEFVRCNLILYLLRKTLRYNTAMFTLLKDNCAQTIWKKQTQFHSIQKLVLDDRRLYLKGLGIKILDKCLFAL